MRTDSFDKIKLKSAPKQYKSKPGATGAKRLYLRLFNLQRAAAKLAQKPDADPVTVLLSDELTRAISTVGSLVSRSWLNTIRDSRMENDTCPSPTTTSTPLATF